MTLITNKCQLQPYLTLYVQSSWHALFTKATPTNYMIRHNFNCHVNKRETTKTCLTNHKGSISHHITSLVINILGSRGTHTYSHCEKKQFQETSDASPGLKTVIIQTSTYKDISHHYLICEYTCYQMNIKYIIYKLKRIIFNDHKRIVALTQLFRQIHTLIIILDLIWNINKMLLWQNKFTVSSSNYINMMSNYYKKLFYMYIIYAFTIIYCCNYDWYVPFILKCYKVNV